MSSAGDNILLLSFSYAVSVIWEIDLDSFDVLDVWYGRTVIRSRYKMTYEAAQRLFDVPAPSDGNDAGAATHRVSAALLEQLGGLKAVHDLVPELSGLGTVSWSKRESIHIS